jgi:hypothetical protein
MQTAAPWQGAAGDSTGGHKRMLLRRRGLLSTAAGALSEQGAALLEPFVQQYAPASFGRTLKVNLAGSADGGHKWGDRGAHLVGLGRDACVLGSPVFVCAARFAVGRIMQHRFQRWRLQALRGEMALHSPGCSSAR